MSAEETRGYIQRHPVCSLAAHSLAVHLVTVQPHAPMETREQLFMLEGPDHFLDVVYETIEAHVRRTGDEYGQVITGVGTAEMGDVEHETESVLPVYVSAAVDPDEAHELIGLALDRIADEHNMDLARQSVQVVLEEEGAEGG